MDETDYNRLPAPLTEISAATQELGFNMASVIPTGALLRSLAASKPKGKFLELGTGTGISTAWILDGMCPESLLISLDYDKDAIAVAETHLANDGRVTFLYLDGAEFLENNQTQFDFVFADAWAGKYHHVEEALACLRPGGFYIIDDMLPQENWPEGHAEKVAGLIALLDGLPNFQVSKMNWSSGIVLAVKKTD